MNSLHRILFVAALFGVTAQVQAQDASRCADMPAVSVTDVSTTSIRIPGPRPDIPVPRVPSAKELYLRALCGRMPAEVLGLIERGEGAVLTVPEDLSVSLDAALPYLPRVRFMYVRGGGVSREVIVVLFADGYRGPYFFFDEQEAWTETSAGSAEVHWNRLPYEFMRRATRRLHDVGRFRHRWRVTGGAITRVLPFVGVGRGMANPVGTMFVGSGGDADHIDGERLWVHELGHFLHYEIDGVNALAYARGYTGIARRNRRVFGVDTPFIYKQRHREARRIDRGTLCRSAAGVDMRPWGYTSAYGRCGIPTEDFADSMCAAMGATQIIQELNDDQRGEYLREYNATRLFTSEGDDLGVMSQRMAWVRENLNIDHFGPQDADGDGVTWQRGVPGGDCDDRNPVIGICECTSGESETTACGSRCGTQTRTCEDGRWNAGSSCQNEGECTPGSRTLLRTEREVSACGTTIVDYYSECSAACEAGTEIRVVRDQADTESPEVCDGEDNDCDGVRDEVCPSDFMGGRRSEGPYIPSAELGSSTESRCGEGAVVTGVRITTTSAHGAAIRSARVLCRHVRVGVDASRVPYRYSVELGSEVRGSGFDLPIDETLRCSEGEVVVGFRGGAQSGLGGNWLSTMQLTCAPLRVEGEGTSWRIVRGESSSTATFPSGDPRYTTSCVNGADAARGIEMLVEVDAVRGFRSLCEQWSVELGEE